VIDVLRSDTVNEVYAKEAEAKKCKVYTLWVCDWLGRPTSLLRPSDAKAITVLGHDRIVYFDQQQDPNGILLFLEVFDARGLRLVGSVMAQATVTLESLLPHYRTAFGHTDVTEYLVFVAGEGHTATKFDVVTPLRQLRHGTILVFQPTDFRFGEPETTGVMSFVPPDFRGTYEDFVRSQFTTVVAGLGMVGEVGDRCAVRFPLDTPVDSLKRFFGERLGLNWDPAASSMGVWFFQNGVPAGTTPFIGENMAVRVAFWRDVPEHAMRDRKAMLVFAAANAVTVDRTIGVAARTDETLRDVAHEYGFRGLLRFSLARNGKVDYVLDPDTKVTDVDGDLRIDELRTEQPVVVPVFVEPATSFFLEVVGDETVEHAVQRIKALAGVDGKSRLTWHIWWRNNRTAVYNAGALKLSEVAPDVRRIALEVPRYRLAQPGVRIRDEKKRQ
jgi:hypothetical protein